MAEKVRLKNIKGGPETPTTEKTCEEGKENHLLMALSGSCQEQGPQWKQKDVSPGKRNASSTPLLGVEKSPNMDI